MQFTDECPLVAHFDPSGFGWSNFAEDESLDWDSLTFELLAIVCSEAFRNGDPAAMDRLGRLYNRNVEALNLMGCGWFMGFVAGAKFIQEA